MTGIMSGSRSSSPNHVPERSKPFLNHSQCFLFILLGRNKGEHSRKQRSEQHEIISYRIFAQLPDNVFNSNQRKPGQYQSMETPIPGLNMIFSVCYCNDLDTLYK